MKDKIFIFLIFFTLATKNSHSQPTKKITNTDTKKEQEIITNKTILYLLNTITDKSNSIINNKKIKLEKEPLSIINTVIEMCHKSIDKLKADPSYFNTQINDTYKYFNTKKIIIEKINSTIEHPKSDEYLINTLIATLFQSHSAP